MKRDVNLLSGVKRGTRYLIIPAIGASSDLDTISQAVGTTKEIGTEFGDIIGSGVVQAYDE